MNKRSEENTTGKSQPLSETYRPVIDACYEHADDLYRAAIVLHTQEKLHHIAFHLGVLALEEIGKAGLLISSFVVGQHKEPPAWIQKHTEDHVRKLFWAFWGPQLKGQVITGEYLKARENAARTTHQMRLRGLYVGVDTEHLNIPREAVSEDGAASLLRFVEANLALRRSYSLDVGSDEEQKLLAWFLTATDDETKSDAIFGKKSLEKWAEIGDTRAWIAWLKEQYDDADRKADEMRRQELQRERPNAEGLATTPKWSVTIRLHSTTHSVRPKALGAWNKRSYYIKLSAVNHYNDQLLVELLLPKSTLFEETWNVTFATARRYIAALNIASLGHFWWYLPEQTTKFYERMRDLESDSEVVVEKRSPALEPVERRRVLEERDLIDAGLFYAAMPMPDDKDGSRIFHDYLGGLTFIAKQDVHLSVEPIAYKHLFDALKRAIAYYEPASDQSDLPAAFHREFGSILVEEKERQEYLRLGELAEAGKLEAGMVDLERVLNLKILCDIYLHRVLLLRAKEQLKDQRGTTEADSQ